MTDIKDRRDQILNFLTKIYYEESKNELDEMAEQVMVQLECLPFQSLVAVRSSSTLEDLSRMAGAGLFDSFLNVSLDCKQELIDAIVRVWLSLFTERAIISRK